MLDVDFDWLKLSELEDEDREISIGKMDTFE
jgi:hypothetical protein